MSQAKAEWISFWLHEARSPEQLADLVQRFPKEAEAIRGARPLLVHAVSGELSDLRVALDAEVRAEQEKDRRYWEPLKREMEEFRRQERE